MQIPTSPTVIPTTASAGVVVSTAIGAGGRYLNHSDGIVVSSAIQAGGRLINHSETLVAPDGIAVTTPIRAGGISTSPGG
jgi:hypothetical protein